MAESNNNQLLKLEINSKEAIEWASALGTKGEFIPVGPLATLVPRRFHPLFTKELLKSYVAPNEARAVELRAKIFPADIPVITKLYTETVYTHILENLTEEGKVAVELMHPWIVNVLIDWGNFDQTICSKPIKDNVVPQTFDEKELSRDTNNCPPLTNNEEKLVEPSIQSPRNNELIDIDNGSETKSGFWKKEAVLKLIEYYTKHESLFSKIGYKKKNIWEKISAELNKAAFRFTPVQCEQKWKNLTKAYRDTVDHNAKSGNDVKQCQYFSELQAVYGYRPNCKPTFIMSSGIEDISRDGSSSTSDPIPSTSASSSKRSHSSSPQKKRSCKRQQSDQVVNLLKDIQKDMKEDQNAILEQMREHHRERMDQEDRRLSLMEKLINKLDK